MPPENPTHTTPEEPQGSPTAAEGAPSDPNSTPEAASSEAHTDRLSVVERITSKWPWPAQAAALLACVLGVGGLAQLTECGQVVPETVRAWQCSDTVPDAEHQAVVDERNRLAARVHALEVILFRGSGGVITPESLQALEASGAAAVP